MKNRLPGSRTSIHHYPVTFHDLILAGELRRDAVQVSHDGLVCLLCFEC